MTTETPIDESGSAQGPISRWLSTAQPEALFVLSAIAQYAGAALAVVLFDRVEPQTVADGLKVMVDRLTEVLAEQRNLRREVQETRKVKNRLLEEHKERFLYTARTLEGLYRLAGEKEHAERIRPSTTRPGRRAAEVEGEAAEESSAAESTASESAESAATESTASESTATESTATESTATESA